jgi:hypothetical protein
MRRREEQRGLTIPPRALPPVLPDVSAELIERLAGEQFFARTPRLYLGHLGRPTARLREQYRADLVVEATSHDLREYRTRLAARQEPTSINTAPVTLQRFCGWAQAGGRISPIRRPSSSPSIPSRWHARASRSSSPTTPPRSRAGPWLMPNDHAPEHGTARGRDSST